MPTAGFLENVRARLLELGLSEACADELAPRLEREASRCVRALAPEPVVGAALASRELATDWPLYSDARFGGGLACEALAAWAFGQRLKAPTLWHADVTRNEIADALERAAGPGADAARWVAATFRSGRFVAFDGLSADAPGRPWLRLYGPGGGGDYPVHDAEEGDGGTPGRRGNQGGASTAPRGVAGREARDGAGRRRAEAPPDEVAQAVGYLRAGTWFDVRAVSLVVDAVRRTRIDIDVGEALRFALRNVRLLREGGPGANPTRGRVVAAAIDAAAGSGAVGAAAVGAWGRERLASELEAALVARLEALGDALPTGGRLPEGDDACRARFTSMNEAFAAHVERLGATGAGLAADVRGGPGEGASLWRLWAASDGPVPGCRFAVRLALALLLDTVVPALEASARKPPAIVRPVYQYAIDFHSRGRVYDERSQQLSFDGQALARLCAQAGASIDMSALQKGLGLLGSVVSHKVFRWEVFSVHERFLRGDPLPNVLVVNGGWSALAKALGLNPDKHASDVRSVVLAQAHFSSRFPDGSQGTMLSYTEKAAFGRTERARVTITVGAPLLPGYVEGIGEKVGRASIEARQARKLVPILREVPPLVGRPNEHGAQISLSMYVVAEMRDKAKELVTDGGVHLPFDALVGLADRSSLPRRHGLLLRLLDRWTADGAGGFLERVDRDRYTLGRPHEAERLFLEEAGRRELVGAKAGRASARRRTAGARVGKRS
jgi:hypothetical protein